MAGCKRRIEALIRLVYTHWKRKFPRINESCPDEETLACFIDRRLDKKEDEKIMPHLISCPKCSEIVLLAMKMIRQTKIS
ncbi:MAG: hypothetical protein ABIH40_03325 [Candidatus Omnitrophota bacterium]